METIDAKDVQRGDILVSKSTDPVLTVASRDDIQNVTIMTTGGAFFHMPYGETIEVMKVS